MQIAPDRTLLHLTDLHFLPNESDRLHNVVDTMQTLRDSIDHAIGQGVNFSAVLVTGDLANYGEIASYQRLRATFRELEDRLQAPVLVAMGNHDRRETLREGLLGEAPSADPYHYTTWIDGLRIVVLDSSIPELPHGELDEAQLAWLRTELATPAPEGTIVAVHHPPVPGPVPVINVLMLRNAEALADAIRGTDVLGVLAGHVHHPTVAPFAGVVCASAPATAYTVDPLGVGTGFRGVEGPGFNLVQLYGRTLVASSVLLATDQREIYRHELTEEQVRAWAEPRKIPAAAA